VAAGDLGAVNENVAIGTAVVNGAATDADGNTLTYTLGGADAGSFVINAATGAVTWGVSPNFETKASYSFSVIATDNGAGALTDTHVYTLTIANVNEAPTVTCVGTPGGFDCSWTAWSGSGTLNHYRVEVSTDGTSWSSAGITDTTSAVFGGLSGATEYQIRVAAIVNSVAQEFGTNTETTAALPAGTAGPAGSAGPAGPAGSAGPAGPAGPAGSGGSGATGATGASAQTTLVLTLKSLSIPVGESTTSTITGGSGTGAVTYSSDTTAVCTVSTTGVVTGVKIGDCNITATKAASTGYASAISFPVAVKVTKSLADLAAEAKLAADAKAKADADAATKAKADADAKAKADEEQKKLAAALEQAQKDLAALNARVAEEARAKAAAEADLKAKAEAKAAADAKNLAVGPRKAGLTPVKVNLANIYRNKTAVIRVSIDGGSFSTFGSGRLNSKGDATIGSSKAIPTGAKVRVTIDGTVIVTITR